MYSCTISKFRASRNFNIVGWEQSTWLLNQLCFPSVILEEWGRVQYSNRVEGYRVQEEQVVEVQGLQVYDVESVTGMR